MSEPVRGEVRRRGNEEMIIAEHDQYYPGPHKFYLTVRAATLAGITPVRHLFQLGVKYLDDKLSWRCA